MKRSSNRALLSCVLGTLAAAGSTRTAVAQPTVLESSPSRQAAAPARPVARPVTPPSTPRDNSRSVTSTFPPAAPRPPAPAPLVEPGRSVIDTIGPGNGPGGGVQDAGITLIDMEGLRYNDSGQHDAGRQYVEDGFVLAEDNQDAFNFNVYGTQNGSYCGSTAMFNNTIGGTTYLYAVNYSPFSLEFMEFANLAQNGPSTVTVHAMKYDGTVLTRTCTLQNSDIREETFYFPGFNDLYYVYWTQDDPFHQFDNIGVVRTPTVVDLQALEVADAGSHDQGHTVYEDGFVIDNSGDASDMYTFGTLEGRYPGSTALFNNTVGGTTTVTQYGGGTFNIHSIDLSSLNGNGPVTVTFTGHRPGGSTMTKTFTTQGAPVGLQTFQFTGFNNIESLSWTQDYPYHQFDNIVLSRGQQTLDFAKLSIADDQSHYWGKDYRQDGFRIKVGANDSAFKTFGIYESRFPGSTALFNNTVNGTNHLETTDGTLFQILGIELANLNGDGPVNVHFTGHKSDGSEIGADFSTSGPGIRLETFQFDPSWRGLKDVEWTQASPFHQFDNIRLVRQTNLMDCQKLEHVDDQSVDIGNVYAEEGFRLTKGQGEPFGFYTYGTLASAYNGSTSVFNDTAGGLIRLSCVDGGDFDLLQMDLSTLVAGLGNATVNFVGTKVDGSQVSQSFNIDGTYLTQQTCRFIGFDTLKYVEWTQEYPYHQIDNIVAVESVPSLDCYADCDGNGTLDLFDFLCFVNSFNAADPSANCDGNGTLDLFDFLCYVNAFNAGC